MDCSLPYVRLRFLPNNQIIVSQVNKKSSRPEQGDTEVEKNAVRQGQLAQQIDELIVAKELVSMVGSYVVELPVSTYKLESESLFEWENRHQFFLKDSRFRPYLPYLIVSGEHHADIYESERRMLARHAKTATFLGTDHKGDSATDRLRISDFSQLPKRAGYVWGNFLLKQADVDSLEARLKARISPGASPLDITRDFQEASGDKGQCPYSAPENSSRSLGSDYPETRFSHSSVRKVHCAGYVFDRLCQHPDSSPNAAFITLTLPGGTELAKRTLAGWSGYLQNRLMQVIRDCEKKNDITLHWLKCWEFQKRGALHLHLVLGADPSVSYSVIEDCAIQLRGLWYKLLLDFGDETVDRPLLHYGGMTGRLPLVDMFERANSNNFKVKSWRSHPDKWQDKIVKVDKSVGRYLSKYQGKSKDFDNKKQVKLYYPSRWYGCSRALSQETKRLTVDVSFVLAPDEMKNFDAELRKFNEKVEGTTPTVIDFVILNNGVCVKKGSPLHEYMSASPMTTSSSSVLLKGSSLSFFSAVDLDTARECLVHLLLSLPLKVPLTI